MSNKLILNPLVDLRFIKGVGLVLLSEKIKNLYTGQIYERLAEGLSSYNTTEDLLANISKSSVDYAELSYIIDIFKEKKILIEVNTSSFSSETLYYKYIATDDKRDKKLSDICLSILNLSSIDTHSLINKLENCGVKHINSINYNEVSSESELMLIVVDDYLDSRLEIINKKLISGNIPWVLCKLVGQIIWVGPYFNGTGIGCYKCLNYRLICNDSIGSFLEEYSQNRMPSIKSSFTEFTLSLGISLLYNYLFTNYRLNNSQSKIITYDTINLNYIDHQLINRPQCNDCGNPSDFCKNVLEINFSLMPDVVGDRIQTKEFTYNKLKHHIDPITGIIKSLKESGRSKNERLFYLYSADHYFLHKPKDLNSFFKALYMCSGGKGRSEIEAKLGAICESLERYSGIYQGYEVTKLATYDSIKDVAVDPALLTLWSKDQYLNRKKINEYHGDFQRVPEPINYAQKLHWTEVTSLTNGKRKYIPTAYAYYGGGGKEDWRYLYSDSNGVAAGSCLEEAIFHGLLEIFERDAVGIWWYNQIQLDGIDITSFKNDYINKLILYYKSLGRKIKVINVSNEFPIHVFAAISYRIDNEKQDIVYGFAAHLNPEKAILSALMELNQTLQCVVERNNDGTTLYKPLNNDCSRWWQEVSLENSPYLMEKSTNLKTKGDLHNMEMPIGKAIKFFVDLLRDKNYEVLVLNQTRPDVGLSVCKVMVPGLRHFWKRFAPGRLYTVPVKLGWLDKPKKESELNKYPVFF